MAGWRKGWSALMGLLLLGLVARLSSVDIILGGRCGCHCCGWCGRLSRIFSIGRLPAQITAAAARPVVAICASAAAAQL